ncbi:hypothetical protein RE6C_03353 [Rhodopirellula europaea 6C]|uniref:Uncharacterized protein n=1 Tax=Rhodopirellula europaea 6C TaxID=1263867 RepID=M2A621_9BACT|nr:hypothetical protein RE6C_03353 [Rhodopirellula europaea 6C]
MDEGVCFTESEGDCDIKSFVEIKKGLTLWKTSGSLGLEDRSEKNQPSFRCKPLRQGLANRR